MNVTFDPAIVGPWVISRGGGDWTDGNTTAIGRLDKNGQLMAGVLFDSWNGSNIMQHIAGEGNWATPWFLGMIFHYPFVQLGAKRTTAAICSTNLNVRRLVEHMGFEYETVLKKATKRGDLLIYVMWPEKCKYLDDRYTKYFVK